MAAEGQLHISEDFKKAKRNLIWFCSFTILLGVVDFPKSGAISPPMFGAGTEIEVIWLRGLSLITCCYALVGFVREARNVDRLNSKALYANLLTTIYQRLEHLNQLISETELELKNILSAAKPVQFVQSTSLEAFSDDFVARTKEDRARVTQLIAALKSATKAERRDDSMAELEQAWQMAQGGIDVAARQPISKLVSEAKGIEEEITGVRNLLAKTGRVFDSIETLNREFHKLSDQISGEHRMMYVLYDKALSYGMFLLAVLAGLWPLPLMGVDYVIEQCRQLSAGELVYRVGVAILLMVGFGLSYRVLWRSWRLGRQLRKQANPSVTNELEVIADEQPVVAQERALTQSLSPLERL